MEGKDGRAPEGMPSVGRESATENSRLTPGEKQPRKSVFTLAQFHELQKQFFIFNYLWAGLEIPYHLVASMREDVSTSGGPACCGVYKHYPLFGRYNSWSDSIIELQPWRCRRTDGKKWRCSNDTLLNEKYCERHMNRGRNRSKNNKIDEKSQPSSPDSAPPSNIESKNDLKILEGSNTTTAIGENSNNVRPNKISKTNLSTSTSSILPINLWTNNNNSFEYSDAGKDCLARTSTTVIEKDYQSVDTTLSIGIPGNSSTLLKNKSKGIATRKNNNNNNTTVNGNIIFGNKNDGH